MLYKLLFIVAVQMFLMLSKNKTTDFSSKNGNLPKYIKLSSKLKLK